MRESPSILAEKWCRLQNHLLEIEPEICGFRSLTTCEDVYRTARGLLEQFQDTVVESILDLEQRDEEFLHLFGHDGRTFSTLLVSALQGVARKIRESLGIHQETAYMGYQGLLAAVGSMEFFVPEQKFVGEQTSLITLLREHENMLRGLFKEQGGTYFDLTMDSGLPDVYVHRSTLLNLLINIVQNACKHGSADWIYLNCGVVNSRVKIIVEDDGEGISDEANGRLYEYGFTTNARGGRGLGLGFADVRMGYNGGNISHEAHGGIGEGAKFVLEMPVCI